MKYKGRYKKCRECKHVIEVMMFLVEVKPSCPKGRKLNYSKAVDKPTCEGCEFFEREGDK